MIKQLLRDESGVALGIAIMVMVIIGVMGAGLLVFVRNDLEAVIEVNQGQRAFDIADAGAQVAKQQLLGDKEPGHYDLEGATLCNTDARDPDDTIDTANDILRNPSTENWAPGAGGQPRSFADGQFTVTIQWLNPDPTAPPGCIAPETGTPPPGTDYFKVISTGEYRNATRRVEAIYETYDLNVPRAYYTPGKIKVAGSACIDSVSLFSASTELDAITIAGTGSGCGDGSKIKGPDLAYGDWNDPPSDQFNTTARSGLTCPKTLPDGTPVDKTCAGFATVGGINGSKRAGLDYDKDTNPPAAFVADPDAVGLSGQQTDEITYPFDVAAQPDPVQLCSEAQAQGNYRTESGTGLVNLTDWPANSSHTTVVCFNFTNPASNNELRWAVGGDTTISGGSFDGCKEPRRRGTLVIRGGAFSVKPKTALFQGVVVVRGPADQESTVSNTDDAGLSGNTCLDGFINSTGVINITGSVSPSGSAEINNRPGFYGVRTWGWRELYQ
jgi:hypothetical protein